MNVHDLPGEYLVKGTNQDISHTTYEGVLLLKLDSNNKIIAEWSINQEQAQFGIGFFQDDILVINFNYIGQEDELLKGVVVYRMITINTLKGFWSEKHGDQCFLGSEVCTRVNEFGQFSEN